MQVNITSRRQKRANKYEERTNLLRMYRTLNELQHKYWSRPLIKLDTPIRSGWKRSYILRSDVANRADAHIYEDVLREINSTRYCANKDFMAKAHKGKTWEPIPQQPNTVRVNRWEELRAIWTPQHLKHFAAYTHWTVGRCHYHATGFLCNCRYCNIPPFYFDFKVEPHFITHVRECDPELESKIAHLQNHFRIHNLWTKIANLHGYSHNGDKEWWCHKDKSLATAAQLQEWKESGFDEPFNDETYEFKKDK